MPGTTPTAVPSFSHDQHHKTDAAKLELGALFHNLTDLIRIASIMFWTKCG